MCLVALAWQVHPRYTLLLAGNRDEMHARPSAAADWWTDAVGVLGGRDLSAGGSWLAVTRAGRFAVVTNHRDLRRPAPAGAPSRGELVQRFVTGHLTPARFAADLRVDDYAGFNLLVGDRDALWYVSNRAPSRELGAGAYTLSNATLDEAWPKTRALATTLDRVVSGACGPDSLLDALADRGTHPADALPDTGLTPEQERLLSAAHIVSPVYGTRAATLLTVTHDGEASLTERSFAPDAGLTGVREHRFRVEQA